MKAKTQTGQNRCNQQRERKWTHKTDESRRKDKGPLKKIQWKRSQRKKESHRNVEIKQIPRRVKHCVKPCEVTRGVKKPASRGEATGERVGRTCRGFSKRRNSVRVELHICRMLGCCKCRPNIRPVRTGLRNQEGLPSIM